MSTWREQPLFFDHEGVRLYGVWYPALRPASPRGGIVLCPALGAEADQSVRVLVHFARAAQAAGWDVFRFDYRGCGDSEGEFEDATLGAWLDDLQGAVEFFRRRAALDTVGLVGLRLGGTLAVLAGRDKTPVDWLCLWEPLIFPQRFVDELLHMQLLSYNLWAARPLRDRRALLALHDRTVELLGYCWSKEVMTKLQQLDVPSVLNGLGVPSCIVTIAPESDTSKAFHAVQEALPAWEIPSALVEVKGEIFWHKSSRPDLDLAKLRRLDELFDATLRWITEQSPASRHA